MEGDKRTKGQKDKRTKGERGGGGQKEREVEGEKRTKGQKDKRTKEERGRRLKEEDVYLIVGLQRPCVHHLAARRVTARAGKGSSATGTATALRAKQENSSSSCFKTGKQQLFLFCGRVPCGRVQQADSSKGGAGPGRARC